MVELNIANFKADITWIRNDPSLFSQVERRVQNQVEVLHQWATVHESLLEKYRDEKSFTFLSSFARSESTAAVITALIALNANHNNLSGQARSVISFSGLGKLDLLLNQTKTKVLKCVSLLLSHVFEELSQEEANNAPMSSKLLVLLPHLIESLALFATDKNLNELI